MPPARVFCVVPLEYQKFSAVELSPFVPSVLPAMLGTVKIRKYRAAVLLSVTDCPGPVTAGDGDPPIQYRWYIDAPSVGVVPTAEHAQNDSMTVLPACRATPSIGWQMNE